MRSLRIAIIGAGPSGLILACILRAGGLDVHVFESDNSTSSRDQGGTLDLHPGTGQRALELAGLKDKFLAAARVEDQNQRVLDYATADVLYEEILPPGSGDKPEIDRKALRDLMLSAIEPSVVRWGYKLADVQTNSDNERHFLTFANGATESFDLVIGADGGWSRVRRFLSDVSPIYTGVSFVEGWFTDVDVRHPKIAALVGRGTVFALHRSMGIFAQRNGYGHVRVYAAFRRPESWPADLGIDLSNPASVRTGLLRLFAAWSPTVLELIEQSLDIFVPRPIYTLPADFGWDHRPGVTLVGDAAHLMPPVGLGVNLAMLDATELAVAIREADDWDAAILRQEVRIQTRAREMAAGTIAAFDNIYADDAPAALLAFFRQRATK